MQSQPLEVQNRLAFHVDSTVCPCLPSHTKMVGGGAGEVTSSGKKEARN